MNVYINDNIQRVESKDQVLNVIDGVQKATELLKNTEGDIEFLFYMDEENKVRYSIFIVDIYKDPKQLKKYAVFLVPQGR